MRDIKRRITSVQNIKQITKAMEMVAAAKLRRAQEKAESARPYTEKMREVIASVAVATDEVQHPMLVSRPVKKTGYLVITSDRGLAGGFDGNLLRTLVQTVEKRHGSKDEYVVFVMGRKGSDFLKRRDIPVIGEVTGLPDSLRNSATSNRSYPRRSVLFAEEEYDELFLVYNEFINPVLNALSKSGSWPIWEKRRAKAI